jgi:hypothetical protein
VKLVLSFERKVTACGYFESRLLVQEETPKTFGGLAFAIKT